MRTIISIVIIFLFGTVAAQDVKSSADMHFNNQEWQLATKDYQQYLKATARDSAAWYNLGYSYLQLKNYDEAIRSFDKAEQYNFPVSYVSFSKAKAYMLKGDHAKAVDALQSGADNGSMAYASLLKDTSFDPIRNDPAFQKAMKKTKENVYPCLSDPKYRQLDFWAGEWEVYANGNKVGENTITIANGGCALHENYISNLVYTGQSINYYDPIDNKWHQHWVGSAGDVYDYTETDKAEGMLQLKSKFVTRKGKITLSRMTFSLNEDGTVRQLMESSADDGKTWSIAFDGLYKKK